MLMATGKVPFKVDIDSETLTVLRETLKKHKIGYSLACEGLFRWFCAQDGLLRSLMMGTMDEEWEGQLTQLLIDKLSKKLADAKSAKGKAGASGEGRKRGGSVPWDHAG